MTGEIKFLLQLIALFIALFASFVNFSRTSSGREVAGLSWAVQAAASTAFVALTWF